MEYPYFPTKWQQVIFRNYGIVKTELIARILHTDVDTVIENANLLGLDEIKYNPDWIKKGFVTVIRNNWNLLSNSDICVLLEMTEDELNKILIDYDFLSIKLGKKDSIDEIIYKELSDDELEETNKIATIVKENYVTAKIKPFDFYSNYVKPHLLRNEDNKLKTFVANYCANYCDSLLDDNLTDYSEYTLKRIADSGVTGIWIAETLKNLAEFPFDKSLSTDYKKRITNLKKLTERCAKYGIDVYLYVNEPRSMPESFFDKYPDLKGQKTDEGDYCLCTSNDVVKNYLYNAFKSIAENVPKLYAIMTITMSENPTHCYSRTWKGLKAGETTCPKCSKKRPEELCVELCNIYAKGLYDGNGYTKLIANLWGWTEEMAMRGIDNLDKNIDIMCVSEYAKEFSIRGVKNQVIDYSISHMGPSEITLKMLNKAKSSGHKIWAKLQMNNSWECSGVPYLPVFDLMVNHFDNLKKLGVDGYMLGWSLGGYQGGVLPLVSSNSTERSEWYRYTYGKMAKTVVSLDKSFSKAFKEYPFSVEGLYFGGQTLACGNIWSLNADNRESTMVCFTYDDESWAVPYGIRIYLKQYELLTKQWLKTLKKLESKSGNDAFEEYKRVATASYVQLKSAYNLARFTHYKKNIEKNRKNLRCVIDDEFSLTKTLYELISEDAKIGFEMTNHYYYNANLLLEKLVNLNYLKEML